METPPASLATVVLKPGEADRVLAGHPWVYAGAVWRVIGAPADGAVVQVKDHRHRFLGVGLYHGHSKIQVRLLAPERVGIDTAFFAERLRAALALRRRHLPEATCFRVANAESDSLSGLIVDHYDGNLVLQTSALGMDQRKAMIVDALRTVLSPNAVIERNDMFSRKLEGLPEVRGLLWGNLPGELTVNLNGLKFTADLLGGHKTGLYLDQQTNYAQVAQFVARLPGARVLDCFSFSGGFALHAARAGAAAVHLLDQSAEALNLARRHAEMNGLVDRCSFETANVFDWLKARTATPAAPATAGTVGTAAPAHYDVIILDPPSFTRTRASVPQALRGYKEIHVRALRLLAPQGLLATFCCSHHVNAATFLDVILSAAFDSRRVVRRLATFSQAPDHPVIPSIPETEYMKGYALELAR